MIITENSNSFFRIIPCTRCATLTLNAFVPIPCKGSISWAWNNRRKCCKWSKRVACSPLRSQSFAITRNRVPTLLKHDGWAVGRRDEVWGRFARRRRRLSARRVVTDDVSLRRWYREQRGCHVLYPTGERERAPWKHLETLSLSLRFGQGLCVLGRPVARERYLSSWRGRANRPV